MSLRYKLVRGLTPASIRHMSVSHDNKWVAATTARGTVHVFAVDPRGGPVDGQRHVLPGSGLGRSNTGTPAMSMGGSSYGSSDGVLSSSPGNVGCNGANGFTSLSSSPGNILSTSPGSGFSPAGMAGGLMSMAGGIMGRGQHDSYDDGPGSEEYRARKHQSEREAASMLETEPAVPQCVSVRAAARVHAAQPHQMLREIDPDAMGFGRTGSKEVVSAAGAAA
eukprot:CAMPEP_0119487848 /NCGR_PEP_ID=MMETSP1344-20130328/13805_1 /TAXON_ID=236787 /ORGANISM="Florenciella parvula, Strain CCMP2471" /LENGTH=221 /DNA_ID=CAMNT_0007522741 /DNA_START=40 /DNA_END=701 /DNA_ORIENTATION=-